RQIMKLPLAARMNCTHRAKLWSVIWKKYDMTLDKEVNSINPGNMSATSDSVKCSVQNMDTMSEKIKSWEVQSFVKEKVERKCFDVRSMVVERGVKRNELKNMRVTSEEHIIREDKCSAVKNDHVESDAVERSALKEYEVQST